MRIVSIRIVKISLKVIEYILKIFTNRLTVHYETKDDSILWNDTKIELLYGITNNKVAYQITDELLKNNNSIGLEVIWDSLDIKRLKYWDIYLNNKRSYDELLEIVIIYHNSNLPAKRDKMINQLAHFKNHESDLEKLKKLINTHKFIKSSDYKESMYGGY